jgi:FixJ family two-component response regulator
MNHDVQHHKPVYLIEDDPVQRHSMETLLRASGYTTVCFASSEDFLNRSRSERKPGCILLDFVLRGQDGLSFLKIHRERVDAMPVIVLTGHANVALAVDFMAAGASTLLVKPFDADELIDYVAQAIAWDQSTIEARLQIQHVRNCLEQLTDRQRIIKDLVLDGRANKVIAGQLDLSERTIELARADVLKTFGVKNAIELAVLLTQSQVPVPPFTPKNFRKPPAAIPSKPSESAQLQPTSEALPQTQADCHPQTTPEASSPPPIPEPHLQKSDPPQPAPPKSSTHFDSAKRQESDSIEQQD